MVADERRLTATPLVLEACGLHKRFPGVHALTDVDLRLASGEILAVIGENGAGKSTLMKVLSGALAPDAGELRLDGRPLRLRSVQEALARGVALIHQELMLAGDLDVTANITLGREPRRFGFLDRRAAEELARRHLGELGLEVALDTPVSALALGQRQLVEIAKALATDARILIMDEPTSSLSATEATKLFDVMRALRRRGKSIIYISHRLGEVRGIADRVLVLRDGANAGELTAGAIEHDAMVGLMLGRCESVLRERAPRTHGPLALDVRGLRTAAYPTQAVDFSVAAGEFVGLAGLVGAGRTELLEAVFGIVPARAGTVRVAGRDVPRGSVAAAIAAGLALVPEDRKRHGLVLEQDVRANVSMVASTRRGGFGRRDRKAERDSARRAIDELGVRTRDDRTNVRTLSGGNQQKVVLGKWLAEPELRPRVLLLDEPTRGVDVGSKAEIYRLLDRLAADGMGILFASSEAEEVLALADRVLVLREGELTGVLGRDEASEEAILRLAAEPRASECSA